MTTEQHNFTDRQPEAYHKSVPLIQNTSFRRGKPELGITNVCNRPHRALTISNDGECYLCLCEAWLPVSVGNIESFNSLDEVWTNGIAQRLQNDIDNKNYNNCAVEHCGILHRHVIQSDYRINVALDNSCNLSCPSCRRSMINHTQGPEYETKLQRVNHFLKLLKEFNKSVSVILIGNGDPLASAIIRPLVLAWQPKVNQKIILFTNGLLMKKVLPSSNIFSHIEEFQISVDAGTKEVYEIVRRPGRYDSLRENLDWLSENRPKNSSVILKFTLSAANATDIVNFSEMCKHYNFRGIVTKLDDWGTFDDFHSQEVVENTNHPLHSIAVEQIRQVAKHKHIELSSTFNNLL